jgi:hypothetical protein
MERRHFVAGSAPGAIASLELRAGTGAANADFNRVWDHMKAFRETDIEWFPAAASNRDNFVHAMQAAAPAAPRR